ncbi:RNA-binding protein P-like [Salvia splendens]|uniref:RNA-binding protein P-like n=1 Tax=Salvia splendens TaxID=180675 RepID=UPI001C262FE0|nr:RNA-binding protein P-like [Salvia splendens]
MTKTKQTKRKPSNQAPAPAPAAEPPSPTPKIHKKIKKQKKSKPPKPVVHVSESGSDSDSDSVPASDPSTEIQTLLEPFSKEQLISLVIELSSSDDHILSLVKAAADQDIGHRKIFIHGLGWDATRELVESIFGDYGEIEDLNVVADRETGKCKGYAFLTFKSFKSVKKLLKNPRVQVGNRLTSCQLASEGPLGPAAAGIVSQKQFSASDYPQRKIYVSNVPLNASPERLLAFFEKFGEIESGPKGMDPETGRFKGYAIFVFKTLEGAKKVLEDPVKFFEGGQLHCKKAAEGKGQVASGAASITTALQPVQPQMLAAVAAAQQVQNMALLGQQAGLVNPLYGGGLIGNANLGGYYGMLGGGQGLGLGAYGVSGGGNSVPGLGAYGVSSGGSSVPGLGAYGVSGSGNSVPGLGAYGVSGSGNSVPGLGAYGVSGGGSSVPGLGTYGVSGGGNSVTSGAMLQGVQFAYPGLQNGKSSSTLPKTPGAGGSSYSQKQ